MKESAKRLWRAKAFSYTYFRTSNAALFLLLLIPFQAIAQEDSIELPLIVTVDEVHSYEVSCLLDSQTGDLQGVHHENLQEILTQWFDSDHMHLWNTLPQDEYISPGIIETIGLGLLYDPATLELQLTIPQSYRQPQVISVTNRSPGRSKKLNDAVRPENFSAYLNVWGDHEWDSANTASSDGLHHKITLEQVNYFYDWNLKTKDSWKSSSQWEDPQITLGKDFAGITSRLELGHYLVDSQGLQQAGQYQGISFTNLGDWGLQNGNASGLSKTFILEESALVEVWVNHRKVKEIELSPGKYDLRDFAFYSGINTISLIINYESGRIETLDYNQPYQSRLLSQGGQDYHYSAGTDPWKPEDNQIFTANHTLGLSDTLNIGGNFQTENWINLAGSQVKWASPVGILSLDGALQWENRQYQAWGTQGSYLFKLNSRPWFPQFGWNLRYQSPDFQSSTIQWESSLHVGQKLFKNSNASVNLNYRKYTDSSDEKWILSGRYSLPLNKKITCSLYFRMDPADPLSEGSKIQFQVQYQNTERNSTANLSQDAVSGETRADWQKSLPAQGMGLSSGITQPGNSDTESRSAQSGISFRNHRITTSGNISAISDTNNEVDYSSSVQYGTALVFSGKYVAVSSPIYDSFAMVVPQYQLEDRDIGVNPGTRYETKSGWMGPAVISSLNAYHSKEFSLELLDFQEEDFMLMDQTQILLYPGWRSGSLVFVGTPPTFTLKWKFFDSSGDPVSYISGKARDRRGESWFFTDETGTAYAYGLQAGSVNLSVPGYAPLEIQLQESEGNVFDAGTLILKETTGGK